MTRELRIALVGAGPAGQAHAFGYRNVPMAHDLQDVRLVLDTVVDPNLELGASVAARYGFERHVASVDELLATSSVDAVSVALPNHLAAPTLTRLLNAGKHVLAEKPLGRNATEAQLLCDLAAAKGVVAGVGFSYRRIPALAAAAKAVADGAIGTPYLATARFYADYALDPETPLNWRFLKQTAGAGTLMDMGTHALDALEFLVGPISEVTASVLHTSIPTRPDLTAPGSRGAVDTDDTALVSLRFAGGAVGTMVASRVTAGIPVDLSVEVFGSAGHIRFSFEEMSYYTLYQSCANTAPTDGPRRVIPGPEAPHFANVMPMCFRGNPTGYGEAFIAETQDFVRAILTGTPMDTDFATATRTMLAAQAAIDANRTERPVVLAH